MWLRLHPPFGDGKTWESIDIATPTSVKQFLKLIKKHHPELDTYFRASEEETFHQFILIRGDHVINPEDRIMPEDRMVVMMPLTGG